MSVLEWTRKPLAVRVVCHQHHTNDWLASPELELDVGSALCLIIVFTLAHHLLRSSRAFPQLNTNGSLLHHQIMLLLAFH